MSKKERTKQTTQLNLGGNLLRRSKSLERTEDTYQSRITLRRLSSDYYCIRKQTTKSEEQNVASIKSDVSQKHIEILQKQLITLDKRLNRLEESVEVIQNHLRELLIANEPNVQHDVPVRK